MRSRIFVAPALALVAALTPSGARLQERPRFGVSTDLVLIDLIATDGEGALVTDLRADEIQVYEDGKPQRLEFARLVSIDSRGSAAASPSALTPRAQDPQLARSAPSEAAPAQSLVVVVDLATLPFDLLAHSRDAIVAMARGGLDPGTRLMLVTLDHGLQVRLPFTDDLPRFIATVEALKPSSSEGETALADLVDKVENTCDGTPGSVQNAIGLGRAFVEDARLGLSATTEGIGALSRYLAPVPGRKHVVLYSAGYPMQPAAIAASVVEGICGAPTGGTGQGGGQSGMRAGPSEAHASLRVGAQIDSMGMLRSLLDEANRAQVSVYTVDARGLVGDVTPARSRMSTRLVRSGGAQQVQQTATRAAQEILYSIAEGTGGAVSVNSNDLARGMRAAASDFRGYYLLAYAPPAGRREGRFYPIELKVSRPGLRLRYRKGYEWLSETQRAERALSAALRFPSLYSEDGLTLDPWLEAGKLNVAVILPTQALTFRSEGGEYRNDIAIKGVLRDDKGKLVGDRYLFSKSIDMRLPEAKYADLRTRENVEIPNQAPAPKKGRYQLTVVARHSGGRLATAMADVEVP